MPGIKKSDYLKNYENPMLICKMTINGKEFDKGIAIDFGGAASEKEFLQKAKHLYRAMERTILRENGYYKDCELMLAAKAFENCFDTAFDTTHYESFRKGPAITFHKNNLTYSFGDVTISMRVAVSLADFVISTLTKDDNGMFIERNMKPELIDIFHKQLEGADIEEAGHETQD